MAEGLSRREVVEDSLAKQGEVKPLHLRGHGVQAPSGSFGISGGGSAASKLAGSLGQWADQRLSEQINREAEYSAMDGAMAAAQGEAFDKVEMSGDKHAMQGYRVMNATTTSSAVLASAMEKVNQTDFALDPEAFRANYVKIMQGAQEGQDPRTARLIREQMTKQMPQLVEKHTVAHMRYLEDENYKALVQSIDMISRDEAGTEALVNFAKGGEGSASAGLSDSRRTNGVVEGIALAYRNDNPLAHTILQEKGMLEGLSTDQLNSIEAAKNQYQNRRRTEFDQGLFDAKQAMQKEIENGFLSPGDAVAKYADLLKEYNIDMSMTDANQVYTAAQDGERAAGQTRKVQLEAAALRNDYEAMAEITQPLIQWKESRNNPNAMGPVIQKGMHKGDRAHGAMQVMPKTFRNPGFGIEPAKDGSQEEILRVGKEYWRAMVYGSKGSNILKWNAGDIEAAAIAYNAGPGNANKWLAAGRDYSVLPDRKQTEDYAKTILKLAGNDVQLTTQQKHDNAVADLKTARDKAKIDLWDEVAPRLSQLDMLFKNGEMSRDDWEQKRSNIFTNFQMERSVAIINDELRLSEQMEQAARDEIDRNTDAAQVDRIAAKMMGPEMALKSIMQDESLGPEAYMQAVADYMKARDTIYHEEGVAIADQNRGAQIDQLTTMGGDAMLKNNAYNKDQALIDRAVRDGTVGELDKKLQSRAIEQQTGQIIKDRQEQFNKLAGKMSEQELAQAIDYDMANLWKKMGVVDPQQVASESAIINRSMLDKDGNVTPEAVGAMQRYMLMKQTDPVVAQGYLDAEARIRAEAIIAADGGLGQIEQAILDVVNNPNKALSDNPEAIATRQRAAAMMDEAVEDYIAQRDIGTLQVMFSSGADWGDQWNMLGSEIDRLNSPETQEEVKASVSREMQRLSQQDPLVQPRHLVAQAMENVKRKSAVIGGSFVQTKFNIKERMFGTRVNQFDKDGLEHDVVLTWLQSPNMQVAYPELDNAAWTEALPRFMQSGLNYIPFVEGLDEGASMQDIGPMLARGVRPFQAMPDNDGKGLVVRILTDEGVWSPNLIKIDLKQAGSYYMRKNTPE